MSKPRKKSKKILFILEIVVLLLFIGGLFVYGQISAKLDKIDIQETDLADQDIVTNDQSITVWSLVNILRNGRIRIMQPDISTIPWTVLKNKP
mgnify:CR=1 FL=1